MSAVIKFLFLLVLAYDYVDIEAILHSIINHSVT